ncbi:hypothetical protein BO70DRAFT_409875, partial [Aspergillus heteromorphus CBS 117.55]
MPSRHESSARADYVPALCTHARRYYRLNGSVRPSDWLRRVGNDPQSRKVGQTRS